MKKSLRNTLLHNLIYFLLAALLLGCEEEKSADPPPAASSSSVQTAPVQYRAVSAELTIPASIQPDPLRVVHVFAPVSGRLVTLKVKVGDTVRAGQAVAVVQSSDAASARSDYEKAKAQAERSGAALRRVTLLYQHEVVSAKDVEDAKAQAASDDSDLKRARERLELLGLGEGAASDKVTVQAPRAGVVIETTSAPGEFSKSLDASNPLLTIADLSSVWVVGNAYEKDLALISRGAPVSISTDAYPAQSWRAQIGYISDVVDPNTRTVKVRVVLNNGERKLKPDMFATIHVAQPSEKVAVVPAAALLHDGNDAYVIVYRAQDEYERRKVQVARNDAQEVLVRSGLRPGELVVTSGAELLREAAK